MTTYQPDSPSKRRGHHRTATGEAQRIKTRAWIIESAIPVFAQHGPDIPVIDDFVKAAGISRGTFYNYFQTTRELLDATMAALSDEVIATVIPAVENMTNPVFRLATAARLYYRKATLDPLFGAFLGSVSGVGALATEHARADLQDAIHTGLITVDDIDLAEAIAFGIMVFALRKSSAKEGSDVRALAVVRAILSALGAAPAMIEDALRSPLPAPSPPPRDNPSGTFP